MRLDLSTGKRLPDPDDQRIEQCLRSVGQEEEYAILVDDEQGEQHFIQAAKESEGFVVEYREGQRQHRSKPVPLETVVKVFQAYRKQNKSWKEALAWTDITEGIGGKRGCSATAVLLLAIIGLVIGGMIV